MVKYKNQDLTKGKILLVFSTEWCGPCKRIKQKILEIEDNYPDITFIEVEADSNDDLVLKYNIKSVPYIVVLKDNEIQDEVKGDFIFRVIDALDK